MNDRRDDEKGALSFKKDDVSEPRHQESPEAFANLQVSLGIFADGLESAVTSLHEFHPETRLPLVVPSRSIGHLFSRFGRNLNYHARVGGFGLSTHASQSKRQDLTYSAFFAAPVPPSQQASQERYPGPRQDYPTPLRLALIAPRGGAVVPQRSKQSSDNSDTSVRRFNQTFL
jgi:hypothetical protein